jgi:hypothetical protein
VHGRRLCSGLQVSWRRGLEPENAAGYVPLLNIYVAGNWRLCENFDPLVPVGHPQEVLNHVWCVDGFARKLQIHSNVEMAERTANFSSSTLHRTSFSVLLIYKHLFLNLSSLLHKTYSASLLLTPNKLTTPFHFTSPRNLHQLSASHKEIKTHQYLKLPRTALQQLHSAKKSLSIPQRNAVLDELASHKAQSRRNDGRNTAAAVIVRVLRLNPN